MKKIFTIMVLVGLSSFSIANEMYRAPSNGDSGTYFVLSVKKTGDRQFKVLTSRIGKENAYTDFTELEINCRVKQYFELAGSSEDGKKQKPSKPLKDWSKQSKWTSLVFGSSKSDLVSFICEKYK
ncbi:MAG: hypothetical protein PHI38_05890 [Sulfurimonas sp.]|jgi:hypothetical protein|uniref:hypothetical protein n=1 Tax=Sulfurimonas sp. TaxID=2022749 RepID=UPI0026104F56|nr:hypothetical protein [Sulfurimonas sp.]MDD3476381.1 hypothetical protein [Sulfurimonas sp.]